jgi:polynucleotide 5'-hydroxyl-kinase GRC3/NOL9
VQSYRLDVQSPIVDNVEDNPDDSRIADVIPLVVNTMGWNKGLGADLTRRIEDMVEPTDIFEVEARLSERSWPEMTPHDPFGLSKTRSHILEPIATSVLVNNYSAADHRNLSILSYFHVVFPVSQPRDLQQISAASWDTAVPLCARLPYEVDWTLALDKVFLIGADMEDVVSEEIGRVLNGAIVGLVSCDPDAIDVEGDSNQSNKVPYVQGALPVSPSISACRGLALIRSISPAHAHMHVLTPMPPYLLTTCRVMVKGDLEVPVWGMLDFEGQDRTIAGVEKSKVPYLQWGKGEGIGGDRRRIRRNLMRKGQL